MTEPDPKCRHDEAIERLKSVLPSRYIGWDVLAAAEDYIKRTSFVMDLLMESGHTSFHTSHVILKEFLAREKH